MAMDQQHTITAINSDDPSTIIATINHNFQALTERIKDLNISLSYLDVLKISTIFNAPSTNLETNLQNFISTCYNQLANYAGVYIQYLDDTSATLFMWDKVYTVKNGDFIVKLPNSQSLYIPGISAKIMMPVGTYDIASSSIRYELANSGVATQTVANITFPTYAGSGLLVTENTYSQNATINYPSNLRDVRFYDSQSGEEILFTTNPTRAPISNFKVITIYSGN